VRKIRRALVAWMGKGFVVLLVFAGVGLGQAAWAGSLRWRALGPEGGWAESLATAPGLEGTAFAGMAGAGVWLTTDAGSHWTRLPLPPDPDVQYDVSIQYHVTADPADPRAVYVTTQRSLWSSHDRGAHWASSTFSNPISGFAVAPSNPRVLYVSGFSAGPGLGPAPIYRSTDRGTTWRQSDTGITVQPYALAVDPKDPRTLYLAGLAFESSQAGRVAASHDGGLTWEVLSKQTNPDWKLAVRPGLPQVFYACSSVGVFSSSDGGRTWSTLLAARNDRCDLALDPAAPGTLYVVTNDFFISPGPAATLRKSRDGGLTWETIQTVADHVDTLAVDSKRPARLYAGLGKGGVLKSEDGGAHWTVQAAGLLATRVADVAVDPAHAGTLYAAAEGGIFRSGDGGATWTAAGKGLPANAGALRIVASPAAPGVLYAGSEAGFFRSLDGGESWQAAGPDLPLSPVYDVVVDAAVPNRLYAAGYTNFPGSPKPPDLPVLAVSDDGGATWSDFRDRRARESRTRRRDLVRAALRAGDSGGVFSGGRSGRSRASVRGRGHAPDQSRSRRDVVGSLGGVLRSPGVFRNSQDRGESAGPADALRGDGALGRPQGVEELGSGQDVRRDRCRPAVARGAGPGLRSARLHALRRHDARGLRVARRRRELDAGQSGDGADSGRFAHFRSGVSEPALRRHRRPRGVRDADSVRR
jgi:photosystem II stability/assembly factor-like uncharacterized protein